MTCALVTGVQTCALPSADAIRRLLSSPQGLAGCIVILLMLLLVVFGAHLAPYDYTKISLLERYKPPSLAHWFGTDNFGRDVLSRVMVGARATILSALAATALAPIAGSLIGTTSAFVGGDRTSTR